MSPPKNLIEDQAFLGSVVYYRDVWPRRAHVLTPLHTITGTDKNGKSRFQ